MYEHFNNHPTSKGLGFHTVRTLSKILDISWVYAYTLLQMISEITGYASKGIASLSEILKMNGYHTEFLEESTKTVSDFCKKNKTGKYVLIFEDYCIPVIDGRYFDLFDSGKEEPLYYWRKSDVGEI